MKPRAFVIILMVFGIALVTTLYRNAAIQGTAGVPEQLMGTVWPQPRVLSDFRLRDHLGREFGRAELLGQWTLMFFGYTSCPDICPTTMQTLGSTMTVLEESGADRPRVVMVSVDPERDDAQKLEQYVTYFGEDFVGARGEESQLQALALQVGAMYERETPDGNGNYDVAHSASIFLLDPRARMYAAFSPPHHPDDMAEKLVAIRNFYNR